jgi:hypothetical protein
MIPFSFWKNSASEAGGSLFVPTTSDYAQFGISGTALTAVTVEFWAKIDTDPAGIFGWANIKGSGSPFIFLYKNSSTNVAYYVNNNYWANATVNNDWNHYAVSWTGTVWKFYLNGTEIGSHTGGSAHQSTADNIYINGGFGGGASNSYFAELRVWDIARTGADIAANYNQVIAPQTGLIAYYKLNDALESSGNSYSTLFSGTTFSTDTPF